MTDLSTGLFSEGTVSTDPSNPRRLIFSAMIGGVGGAVAADTFYAGSACGLIASVADNEVILALDWTGGALANAPYAVQRNSPLRSYEIGNTLLVREYLSALAQGKRYYNVSAAMAAPDTTVAPNPQLNERAIDTESTPWRLWKYDGMAWVLQPGAAGAPGGPGPANTLTKGIVESGPTADFEITGAAPNQVLSLILPESTVPGPANTLSKGTVQSGPTADFEITGVAPNQTINLTLPIGPSGPAGTTAFATAISPPQITADQNDYNPANLSTAEVLLLSSDAARKITGLKAQIDGRIEAIVNVGAFPITLLNESTASTAANRFTFGADIILAPAQAVQIRYNVTAARWQVIATTGAGGGGTDTDRRNALLDRIYQSKLYGGYRRFINAFADGYKASDGVAAGSSSNYSVDTSGGKVSPTNSGGTDQLPTMTAATTAGVTISASSTFGAGYEAWHASDKIVGTNAVNHWASASIPATWTVDFGSGNAKNIVQYSIQPRAGDGGTTPPTAWTFQGSNDGSSWTTLDTQTGVTTGWASGVVRTFPVFANPTTYRYYQFVFTALLSGGIVLITEFTLLTPIIFNNMTVVTTAQTADASVSNGRALIEYDATTNPTLNTDLTVEVTCDGGAHWTTAALSAVGTGQAGRRIAETIDQACTAGTSFAARIKTLNNKNVPIYGTSLTVH